MCDAYFVNAMMIVQPIGKIYEAIIVFANSKYANFLFFLAKIVFILILKAIILPCNL